MYIKQTDDLSLKFRHSKYFYPPGFLIRNKFVLKHALHNFVIETRNNPFYFHIRRHERIQLIHIITDVLRHFKDESCQLNWRVRNRCGASGSLTQNRTRFSAKERDSIQTQFGENFLHDSVWAIPNSHSNFRPHNYKIYYNLLTNCGILNEKCEWIIENGNDRNSFEWLKQN